MDTLTTTPPAQQPRAATGARAWLGLWRALEPLTRAEQGPMMSPTARLAIAGLVVLLLAGGLVSQLLGAAALAALLLTLFLTVGVGAAVALSVPWLSWISFVVYSGTIGLAASTAVGFGMAQAGAWAPHIAFWIVAAVTGALLVRAVRRDLPAARGAGAPSRPATAAVAVLCGSVLGFAAASLDAGLHAGAPQPGGLLSAVGPLWYVGCGLIAASFGLAVWSRTSPAAPVLAAGTVVIASQALMYGGPTVMAAARHLGLVDYIRTFGALNTSVDIYQAWPGLFAGSAWLTDASGTTDPLTLATWWPVLVTPLAIAAVRLLAGRFLAPTAAWIAAAVYALGDAVNSTYFAPQVFGFVLSMTVLALLVAPPAVEATSRRRLRFALAFALVLAVVVTHQISPFMLGLALIALVAFRLVRPWWTPLLALVPAIGWAGLHSRLLARYIDPRALGSLFDNIAPPEHPQPVAGAAAATTLTFYVPAAALVVLGLIALGVVIRRHDRLHFGLAATMASPLGLALGTNYGQEGIFRIVLFAVPWLGILVASATLPARWWLRTTTLTVAFALMMGVNSYGQTGLDWARILRTDDAAVTRYVEHQAPSGAVVLSLGTKNATPARITERYDQVNYTSRQRVGGFADTVGRAYDPEADLASVTDAFTAEPAPGGHYLYVSDTIGAYDDRYGLQRYDDYQRLAAAVAASPDWRLVYATPTARLYTLAAEPLLRPGGRGR